MVVVAGAEGLLHLAVVVVVIVVAVLCVMSAIATFGSVSPSSVTAATEKRPCNKLIDTCRPTCTSRGGQGAAARHAYVSVDLAS